MLSSFNIILGSGRIYNKFPISAVYDNFQYFREDLETTLLDILIDTYNDSIRLSSITINFIDYIDDDEYYYWEFELNLNNIKMFNKLNRLHYDELINYKSKLIRKYKLKNILGKND